MSTCTQFAGFVSVVSARYLYLRAKLQGYNHTAKQFVKNFLLKIVND